MDVWCRQVKFGREGLLNCQQGVFILEIMAIRLYIKAKEGDRYRTPSFGICCLEIIQLGE